MNALILILLPLLTNVRSVPLEHHRIETNPELTGGYFEGDMVLNVNERNGFIDSARRWPNNTVYYKISNHFDAAHRNYIRIAMRSIEKVSCIRFEDVAGSGKAYYVDITGHRNGCNSAVGWWNTTQPCNLEVTPLRKGCFQKGAIVHELLHTLGFFHMHNSWNRNNYVKIVKENIQRGMQNNFAIYGSGVVDNFGQEYDYASIMHYNPFAYSKNGKKTIIALRNTTTVDLMGQRYMMTNSDIVKLNKMYKCTTKD